MINSTALSFRPITMEDREAITAFTLPGNALNCDYAFANMCSWRFLYDSEYAVRDGFLFVRFYVEEKGHRHLAYMLPVGDGDLKTAIGLLGGDAESMGYPLLILGVTPELKIKINTLFPDSFTYIKERDFFDYIYLREDLATLRGKKFQPKRNHVNKFKKQYEYIYMPIHREIVSQCMEVERIWCRANVDENDRDDLAHEHRSMTFAMNHFTELGLSGGAIVVDGKIVAFTYGSPINSYTFGIHVEKADVCYEGIFSVINQEFASRIPAQYLYINREEDLGIPGLRQSKLSYHPVILLEKNAAVKRR
ncbi:MAG: phosphatidylglycerol lysyltransferase domain-containing protein [Tannerella sp.]|jgi:hypothetical protein|nr:phosphatidylglycerol lysyltransferase domain-containing protein [Tannerella sp.]